MSQPGTLPTADDFFGPSQPQGGGGLPTADEFFAPSQPSTLQRAVTGATDAIGGSPIGMLYRYSKSALDLGVAGATDAKNALVSHDVHSSPALDAYFANNPAGRLMHAFGQGAAQGWGSEPLGISAENEALLRKAGIFNDYASGRTDILKSMNEAFIRPAAVAADMAMRAGVAIPHGAGVALRSYSQEHPGTISGDVAGAAGEIVGAIPEGFLPESGFAHGTPEPEALPRVEPTFGPAAADLARARALGVIGEGEDGYFGTKEVPPESATDRAIAAREAAAGQPLEPTLPDGAPAPTPVSEAPVVHDIHTVARQIAPEIFSTYDALATWQDTFRRWLGELADTRENDPRIAAANAEIETILGKVNGVEDRLTKKAAARLDAIRDEVDQLRRTDTPDMARVREALQANDYKMRDLSPQVAAAYRAAQERVGEPAPEEAVPAQATEAQAPAGASATEAIGEPIQGQIPTTGPANQVPVPDIASDVQRKLVAAGRPTEEASAAAQIVAEHYAARASRLEGATAADLYASDAPQLKRGGRLRAREIAQGARELSQSLIAANDAMPESANLDLRGEEWTKMRSIAQAMVDKFKTKQPEVSALGQRVVDYLEEVGAGGMDPATLTKMAHEISAKAEIIANNIEKPGENVKSLFQARRGSLTLGDARNTIRLFKDADASTFMHETGHQWLEELMADAGDERANDAVRADAQTVRDWLGVKDGDTIPTRAHEKFARGFERYLMEGIAPSKNLASVFAKFKAWLTQIYQTVQKLRSPINDDIRSVFDRLMTANPERTIIAPEREAPSVMADTHERFAEETPAEKAASVANKVRSEIDAHVAKEDPEIARELNPNGPRFPLAGEPEPNTPVAGSGDEARASPAEDVTAAESGALTASGNEVAAEGGNGGERTPEPSAANDRFTKRESKLVDKAGNIRLDNLSTPEDVNSVIRDTAQGHNDFITARRGRLTDGEVLDLADALGMDAATLNARKIGEAFSAEQIVAARKLLIRSASDVRDKMAMAATGSDADVMAYAEAKTRHNMIQEQVAGLTAEAGRALRAFRKLEGGDEARAVGDFLKEATGRTLNQLRMEAKLGASLQTPAQVSRFARMTDWQKARGAILEYYVNCLISGPVTHFRYAVGNAINAIVAGGIDTPIAAGIGAVKQGLGLVEKGDRVYLGEAGAQMLAITKGSRDGFRAGYDAFRTGVSSTLPGERSSEAWTAQRAIPGKIGEVINLPSKSVSAIHSFFKSLRYEQNMQAMAYRTAMKEGLNGTVFDNRVSDLTLTPSRDMMDAWEDRESYDELETALAARDIARSEGLSGDALDSRVEVLVANPTPEIKEALNAGTHTETARIIAENSVAATKESLRELYLSPTKYGTTSAWINKAINSNIVFKIMVPFMKIGLQITRNAFVERTLLGFADKDVRDNLLGKNGGAAQDMQWARITTGTAVIGITALMASEGLATGDGPEDPKQRAAWLLTHKPNTITIGDITVPYQGLGSLGMLMRFSANAVQTASMIGHESTGDVAVAALEGLSKSVLDENFLRGMKDALDAIYHPVEYGENYLKGFITNWLPYSVGQSQVARVIDPTLRETKGVDFWDGLINTVKAKTPFISEELMPKRDMFGQPINPANLQTYANDPVVKAMADLQFGVGLLPRKIRGVPLTPQQYDAYADAAGHLTKMQFDSIVAIPGFDSLPAATRMDMMQKAITSSRDMAQSIMMMRSWNSTDPDNPDIVRAALAAKTIGLTGKP